MTIYDRIRDLRISQHMSQSDLAAKLGYKSGSMITKIESGAVDISQTKIIAFAKALSTTPAYLMGWIDQKYETIPYDLTPGESDLISTYRGLPSAGKEYVTQQLRIAQVMFGEKSASVENTRIG